MLAGAKEEEKAETKTEAPAEPAVEPVTIRFATNKSDGEVMCDGYRAFEEYVEKESGGSIQVDIYYNSTLYTDTDMIMAMSTGNCEMGIAGSDKAGVYIPSINCLSMGYLFTSADHLMKVVNGDIGKHFSDLLVVAIAFVMPVVLQWFSYGSICVWTRKSLVLRS